MPGIYSFIRLQGSKFGGSSFFGAGRTEIFSSFEEKLPLSPKKHSPVVFHAIFGRIFEAEDRRWGVLRSSRPNIED